MTGMVRSTRNERGGRRTLNKRGELHESQSEREQRSEGKADTLHNGSQESVAEVANANRKGLSRSLQKARQISTGPDGSGWWATEPSMGRVVNGLPMRVDRTKGLGNSVVPQCVEEAFKILMGIT